VVGLKSEPYIIRPAFGEAASLSYLLLSDARVDIEIRNPSGAVVRTLTSSANQSTGTQEIEWDGQTDAGLLVSADGIYTIKVTVANLESGEVTIEKGFMQVRQ